MKLWKSSQSVTEMVTLTGCPEGLFNALKEGEGEGGVVIFMEWCWLYLLEWVLLTGGSESFLPSDLIIIYLLFCLQIRKKKSALSVNKMGAYLSEPVTEKVSHDESYDHVAWGVSGMQGWRMSMEVR